MTRMNRPKLGRVPLERALSKMGITSRTQAHAWILEGRVSLQGKVVTDPRRMIVPETSDIRIDGLQQSRTATRTILLHKTKGLITTRSDEKGRPTVYTLLGDLKGHLIPIGRLDFATTGFLLMTNDTRFAAWITDPGHVVPRTYLVTVRGKLTEEEAKQLEEGIVEKGEELQASKLEVLKASGRETHLRVELTEGKNREIRRMLASLGHEVTRLKRISFGGLQLGELAAGKWRELSIEELRQAFPGAPIRNAGLGRDLHSIPI